MSGKNKVAKNKLISPIRKATSKQSEKVPNFYQKHKSRIWTLILIIVLVIFFIVNNTRQVPDEGPYPPNYIKSSSETSGN